MLNPNISQRMINAAYDAYDHAQNDLNATGVECITAAISAALAVQAEEQEEAESAMWERIWREEHA